MANFSIPAAPAKNIISVPNFLGVDFSSAINEIDKRRSPDAYNLINNNGAMEKRNGYKILAYLGEKANINGIWNVDTSDGEYFIIHCGNGLYKMEKDFSSYTQLLTGLADRISAGLVLNTRLLILDGKRAIVFNLINSIVSYLDKIGYIPTTQVGRSPNGTKTTPYERANLIQSQRINMFLSTTTDLLYNLDEENLASIESVEILSDSGIWETKKENADYKIDLEKGTVNFEQPIGESPVDGRDNVRIRYSVDNKDYLSQVNRCTILQSYGYNGNNNRVFMSGNPDYPNMITYSEMDDITYIPLDTVINCGLVTAPITGLAKLNNGSLVAQKDVSDADNTLYEIGYNIFDGKEVFPIIGSAKGEGNISQFANDVLINEPLFLSNNGVFALQHNSVEEERYAYHKSYYVDGKLLKEPNLNKAIGICNDGKYYLAINDHVYVADSRFKTTSNYSKYSNYQYEWFYFTNIPVRVWFVWNNKLYFGDKSGNICTFRENDDEDRYKDVNKNVCAYWSSMAFNLASNIYSKTVKRVMITNNPTTGKCRMVVGYILKNGEKKVLDKVYSNSSYPKVAVLKKQAKKLAFIRMYIENIESTEMTFNSMTIMYTEGSLYKGD